MVPRALWTDVSVNRAVLWWTESWPLIELSREEGGISIKTSKRTETFVDYNLKLHVVFFSKSCALPEMFIIGLQAPDIAVHFNAIVEKRKEKCLSKDR